MQITRTNCADQMPPGDETKCIIMQRERPRKVYGRNIHDFVLIRLMKNLQWTIFTSEKWKELNK